VVCGLHFGPWLLFRWFAWILPLVGIWYSTPRADYWLQHLELVSAIPAVVVGFVVSRYCKKLASRAWILPTMVLSYNFLIFTDARASVFASNPWAGFSFYFVIQQHMPTFSSFGGSDPVRVAEQIDVTVPFYSGVAYSIGALLKEYKVLE
jgi:hypothetical protein